MAAPRSKKYRLRLVDLTPGETAPAIAVLAVDRNGKVIHTAMVDAQGQFDLPESTFKTAHRILIGPAAKEPSPATSGAYARYRPAELAAALGQGVFDIARAQWQRWYLPITCVTGSVRVCHRGPWWFEDLEVLAQPSLPLTVNAGPRLSASAMDSGATDAPVQRAGNRVPAAHSLPELIAWPFRCSTLCNGRVEVYRRTCCCEPWIVNDPRLEDLLRLLEELVVLPKPHPPGPGPDPGPYIQQAGARFLKSGTLDRLSVNAARDLQSIRTLPSTEVAAYINARPYLYCRGYSCSTPVQVAEGDINPDGRFNLCWLDFPRPLPRPFCHEEYSYKVKQRFWVFWLTVYDGPAANIWFNRNDDATLVTYHPLAFGCRNNGEPGTGAFVYLDVVGDTSSNELETPVATAWDTVAAPGTTSGLVFPTAASPLNRHRNWGGTLKLNYMFSEDLRLIGAKYYRIGIVEADAAGAPTGPRHYYDPGLSWRKAVWTGTTVNIVPVALGPNPTPIGGQNFLYEIPYDHDADWEADQYHAYLDTTDPRWNNPLVRHLVTIEIFDAAGKRLRPTGTPATGQTGTEGTAAFTYRRKTAATGPTMDVPFGALTHMFWWDNRPVHAQIVSLVENGVTSSAECQFLTGTANAQFGITYRAYHEQVLFNRNHRIWWKRGLAGATGDILNPGLGNVGEPPAPPGSSPTAAFSVMLGSHTRCAFTVFLRVYGKTTDGDDLDYPYADDSAAFALEIG